MTRTIASVQELNRLLETQKQQLQLTLTQTLLTVTPDDCRRMPLALSNTDSSPEKNVALLLEDMEDVTLDFGGSTLVCTGQLMPLTLLGCRRVTIRNLTIDWKIPLSAEGTILQMTSTRLELRIDSALFPFEVREGRLYFLGNGDPAPLWSFAHTAFDPDTGAVCMKMGDELRLEQCTSLSEDRVCFTGSFPTIYPTGAVVVLRHSQRLHAGIFAENCRELTFENITIHATAGLGILCQFCRDLTFRQVRFCANEAKGRKRVCGHDDGLHLTNNAGTITIEGCSFQGLMDDPVNVHGLAARIEQVEGHRTVIGRYVHPQSTGFALYARPGDRFSVIRSSSMHSLGIVTASAFTLLDPYTFRLEFEEDLPVETHPGDALENLTNTPALICRDNFFGPCRARGLLVSTPGPVLIEHNLFRSAGSAILMAGDANEWYESGACRDVTIRDNTFEAACMSTPYQFCEGVVSICPSIPQPDPALPFHQSILLEGNRFFASNGPVLYAFSAENLQLRSNRITGCSAEGPLFRLKLCRQVLLQDNELDAAPQPLLETEGMPDGEVRLLESSLDEEQPASDEEVLTLSDLLAEQNQQAYEELAK